MSLHASEIAAVVQELQPLVGARVDAVRIHAERALTLELFGRGGGATLLVSAEPDLTRLHAVQRRPPQPPAPLALQALLRRELEGARLAALSTRPGERVVELRFDAPAGPLRLVAELTGRHGNLFLVGPDGIIRASAGRNLSQRRELVVGKPYVPPAERAPLGEEGSKVPHTPSPPAEEGAGARGSFPLSEIIEARYAALEAERAALEGRNRLREPVRAALARARRALDKLAEEAARVPVAEEDRRRADLLKQQLHGLARGAREAVLTEWTEEGAREVRVAL